MVDQGADAIVCNTAGDLDDLSTSHVGCALVEAVKHAWATGTKPEFPSQALTSWNAFLNVCHTAETQLGDDLVRIDAARRCLNYEEKEVRPFMRDLETLGKRSMLAAVPADKMRERAAWARFIVWLISTGFVADTDALNASALQPVASHEEEASSVATTAASSSARRSFVKSLENAPRAHERAPRISNGCNANAQSELRVSSPRVEGRRLSPGRLSPGRRLGASAPMEEWGNRRLRGNSVLDGSPSGGCGTPTTRASNASSNGYTAQGGTHLAMRASQAAARRGTSPQNSEELSRGSMSSNAPGCRGFSFAHMHEERQSFDTCSRKSPALPSCQTSNSSVRFPASPRTTIGSSKRVTSPAPFLMGPGPGQYSPLTNDGFCSEMRHIRGGVIPGGHRWNYDSSNINCWLDKHPL